MTNQTVIARIASLLQAIKNCEQSNNQEWLDKHSAELSRIENNVLPHGSGFDNGCRIDRNNSTQSKIVIDAPYHPMDEDGYYVAWRDYRVIVRPRFDGIDIDIKGKDYNGLKEYIADTFYEVLTSVEA